ncbi:ABC transporter substrate-binding protein [Streptomyces sp. CRN 30]|uniref:ABC transporter substrate-binding protein n=1 Tax=Streptomyces sp. CRN 30 TaxID=3075613 RepID=UPI002A829042|nr:ABC transporter substrate-binding protein [Streptomyces sp. CRN 30]
MVDIASYDPAQLRYDGEYPQLWSPVYDTLLLRGSDSSLSPNLATEWSYNSANTILSLTLRDGVEFTDGTPFDGAAVAANIEHFRAGTGHDNYLSGSLAGVDVLDATHVRIRLSEPDPTLLNSLSGSLGAMASPSALGKASLATQPVGSGPYLLDSGRTVRGDRYVFTRNPAYWNAEAWPYDQIEMRVLSDVSARLNALTTGQIDGARLNIDVMDYAERSGVDIHPNRVDWVGLAILDREGRVAPALADVRVRQAINLVFDRQGMLDALGLGQGRVSEQIVGSNSPAYDPELDGTYGHDVERARELMAEAGWSEGFRIPMMDYSRYRTYQPFVEQALATIGIEIDWRSLPDERAIDAQFSGEYPILILGQQAPTSAWDGLGIAYDNALNVFDSSDPEFGRLMETARTTSGDEQVAAFKKANAWLVENAWFAPWYHSDLIYATDPRTAVQPEAGVAGPPLRSYAPKR